MARRPVAQSERIHFAIDPDLVRAIDEWRRAEHDLPGRSEAVRRLVELGLTVKRKPVKRETAK